MSIIDKKAKELRDSVGAEELEAMTRTATFSDAMRMGATTTPQLIGGFINETTGQVCALGATLITVEALTKK